MTRFIEITDAEYRSRMLINVNKIIYVHQMEMGETRACIRYANSIEPWAIVSTRESYDEICEKIRMAGEQE